MTASSATLAGILDANGVIGLSKCGCLSLVPHLFRAVFIPSLVAAAITDPISRAALSAARQSWLVEAHPAPQSLQHAPPLRSEADRQVLAAALEHLPCVIVTGDRALTNSAKQLHPATISAPRVIQLLAEAQLIPAARPHLDQMRASEFGIRQELYETILRELGSNQSSAL
jgi:predicted nucleic acid-binding protein